MNGKRKLSDFTQEEINMKRLFLVIILMLLIQSCGLFQGKEEKIAEVSEKVAQATPFLYDDWIVDILLFIFGLGKHNSKK